MKLLQKLTLGVLAIWLVMGNKQFTELSAETVTPSPQVEPAAYDFTDQILLLRIDRSTPLENKSGSAVIKDAKLVMIGNQYFIQGTGVAPSEVNAWYAGFKIGIKWNTVNQFYAMTPKQFETYPETWKERYEDE